MYIQNINNSFKYELEKLCRIFLPFEKIIFTTEKPQDDIYAVTKLEQQNGKTVVSAYLNMNSKEARYEASLLDNCNNYERECERLLATQLFLCFRELTGYVSEWGILTGVRLAKLFSSIC